jgi:hypothetical protein
MINLKTAKVLSDGARRSDHALAQATVVLDLVTQLEDIVSDAVAEVSKASASDGPSCTWHAAVS